MQSDSFRVLAQELEQPSGETTVTPATIFLVRTNSLIRTLFIFLWSGTVRISEDPLYPYWTLDTLVYYSLLYNLSSYLFYLLIMCLKTTIGIIFRHFYKSSTLTCLSLNLPCSLYSWWTLAPVWNLYSQSLIQFLAGIIFALKSASNFCLPLIPNFSTYYITPISLLINQMLSFQTIYSLQIYLPLVPLPPCTFNKIPSLPH